MIFTTRAKEFQRSGNKECNLITLSGLSETFPEALFFFLQQTETDRKSVGGNQPIIGEKLNRGAEPVENTGACISAYVHPLHNLGSGGSPYKSIPLG